jgi:regulatory protein
MEALRIVMSFITKIETQKKRAGRYSVFLDDLFSFALSANDLLAIGLHVGQELSEEELERIRESVCVGEAYDKALNFICVRKRSKAEVVTYLRQKNDYGDEVIEYTIERLVLNKLIDDVAFARSWIADRNQLKPRSRRILQQELRYKGISSEIAEFALEGVDQEIELNNAITIATKKLTRITDQQKLIAYLMGQGFSYSIVKQAIEQLSSPN